MPYLGKTPSQGVRSRYHYIVGTTTATNTGCTSVAGADQYSKTLSFTDGNYVDVYVNGVMLKAGDDYNTNAANTIGGITALAANDIVDIIVYDTFSLFGGTLEGNVTVSNGTLDVSGIVTATGFSGKIHPTSGTTTNYLSLDSTNELNFKNASNASQTLHINYDGGNVDLGASAVVVTHGGATTFGGDVSLADNKKATFGGGDDLQIYYDGNDAYLKNHSGGKIIARARTGLLLQTNATDGGADNAITANQAGSVELTYANVKKFETTNTGIDVTGGIVADHHVNIGTGYSFQWGDSHERIEQSDGNIEFFTNNSEQMTLSGSNLTVSGDITAKNITLGTALEGWGANSHVIQLGDGAVDNGALAWNTISGGDHFDLMYQCYFDGTNFKHAAPNANASRISQYTGEIRFDRKAGNSTDGATFTWDSSMVIDTSGRVGINHSNPSSTGSKLTVQGDAGSNAVVVKGSSTSGNSWGLGINAGSTSADAGFRVYDKDGSSPYFYVQGDGNVAIGNTVPSTSYKFQAQSTANQIVQLCYNSNASFTQDVHNWDTIRAGSDAFNFFRARTNVGGSPDSEMILQGNGNFAIDGTVTENGADYAEYFEWKDGNSDSEDRVGITVKLDGDKIVPSTSDDTASVIIGVISGKPSVVGDAAWNKWKNKHETDDYGRYVWEEYTFTEWTIPATETEDAVNHIYPTDYIPSDLTVPSDATVVSKDEDGNKLMRRKLNSSYNPSTTYIPREQRPEWDAVGMMGKLRIRKGQTVGDRWIKMRDVSSSVEEWLVK